MFVHCGIYFISGWYVEFQWRKKMILDVIPMFDRPNATKGSAILKRSGKWDQGEVNRLKRVVCKRPFKGESSFYYSS